MTLWITVTIINDIVNDILKNIDSIVNKINSQILWDFSIFWMTISCFLSDKEQLCNKLDGLLAQLFATKSPTNVKKYLPNNYFFGSIRLKSLRTINRRF